MTCFVKKELARNQHAAAGASCQSGRWVLWCLLCGEFCSRTAGTKPSQVPSSWTWAAIALLVPRKDVTSLATLSLFTGLPGTIHFCSTSALSEWLLLTFLTRVCRRLRWLKLCRTAAFPGAQSMSKGSYASHTGLLSAPPAHYDGSQLRAFGLEHSSVWVAFPPDYHMAGSLPFFNFTL